MDTRELALTRFAKAFTEWDRRYREEPGRFQSEASHLLKGTPKTYGEAAAPYFSAILESIPFDGDIEDTA